MCKPRLTHGTTSRELNSPSSHLITRRSMYVRFGSKADLALARQKQTLAIECTGRRSVLSHGRVQVATRARQSPPNYFRVVVWSGVSSITARKVLIVLV